MTTAIAQFQSNNGVATSIKSGRVPDDITLWRISVEQYHAMIESGAIDEDAPIELLEGWLVEKMAKNPSHPLAIDLVCEFLRSTLQTGWFVRSQDPITLVDSEPEPDVIVINGHPRQYGDHHPRANDIALVVEIADSSLGRDRGSKKRIYARAGIPVYWIVNLIDGWVEVYSDPVPLTSEPEYRTHRTYAIEEEIPLIIADVEVGKVSVRDLLPN